MGCSCEQLMGEAQRRNKNVCVPASGIYGMLHRLGGRVCGYGLENNSPARPPEVGRARKVNRSGGDHDEY